MIMQDWFCFKYWYGTKAVSRYHFFYSFILGPVIGEVTQSSAIILVEVEFKDAENPILQCQLFEKVICISFFHQEKIIF